MVLVSISIRDGFGDFLRAMHFLLVISRYSMNGGSNCRDSDLDDGLYFGRFSFRILIVGWEYTEIGSDG